MRILFTLLAFCCVFVLQAAPAVAPSSAFPIQTLVIEGKDVYQIEAASFSQENSALQYKLNLASQYKVPVSIKYDKEKQLYAVLVGPLDTLEAIESIQKQLEDAPRSAVLLSSNEASAPVSAQSSHEPTDKTLWNLRNADIRTVIAEISRVTGRNFIIDPRVQGKISIVSGTPLTKKELYHVFLSLLNVSGYAAISTGPVTKIVPNAEAKVAYSDGLNRLRDPPQGDDLLIEVIPVNYVPADQLVPVLRPLMPQWSNIAAYAPSNRLILSGRANNIKELANIIRQVDTSSASGIDMVPLQHALAMDVVVTLKDLVKNNTPNHTPTLLAADDRSNAILISGTRTERIRLRLLIAKLDKKNAYTSHSNTQVIYLNYLRAEDLVPILAGIAQANFSGSVGTTIGTITRPELDSTNPAASLAGGTSSTPIATNNPLPINTQAVPNVNGSSMQNEGGAKPTVQLIAEPNTNSVIINAPSSLIRILKSVIEQLDIRPAQLLIEALVTEIDASDISRLGIEWGSQGQRGNPNDFRPGFAIINSQTSIDDFQAQLYALAQERKANILSTPSVVVLDNRQAKILVGKQVSVASTSYPGNGNGTAPANPYVTFDRVNVALHLYVRPQITRGRGIQLQIDQGNDTLDPSSQLSSDTTPTFKVSSIVTSVHVESGDIIVLGGLTQDSLAHDDNGLMILKDIPGIGRFFQRNARNREKKVLMVFIRPIILRNEKDAFTVTDKKYQGLREEQVNSLRQEAYHAGDKAVILPALKEAKLPRPFIHSLDNNQHLDNK